MLIPFGPSFRTLLIYAFIIAELYSILLLSYGFVHLPNMQPLLSQLYHFPSMEGRSGGQFTMPSCGDVDWLLPTS